MIAKKTMPWKTAVCAAAMPLFFGCHSSPKNDNSLSKAPTEFTMLENAKYAQELPFGSDARDAEWAKRGLIARVAKGEKEPLKISKGDGSVVWDMGRYAYIKGDVSKPELFPATVNPSLWRQAILNAEYGLFQVCSNDAGQSIYQVRGYDLANISFVETANGFIVVDATSYEESAAAAVKLFYDHLPEAKKGKKIHTIIYTHSHIDHFGGIQGVLKSGMTTGSVAIVAPDRFMEEAVSENVTVGQAMQRRAIWMYGLALWATEIPEGRGQLNNGLAIGSGAGTSGMEPPTKVIAADGPKSFDGTEVEFLLAPHTEAPASLAMLFPSYQSICLGELCNQTQHNILTPRGAQVRDTIAWSAALEKMKQKWADTGKADSAWGSHHWPRWGREAVTEYLDKQSKLYRNLHDQTVDLLNQGYDRENTSPGFDMAELAEGFEFPPTLSQEWFNRGYYGATNFNVKAVHQRYLGWFDNNPVSLWRLPDKASAALYAKYLPQSNGSLVQAASKAFEEGNYRWVVEVLDHVRLAPSHWSSDYMAALNLQADAFEQMAYSAESGIWRNYFLTGAWRNRAISGDLIPKAATEFTKRENAKSIDALPFNSDTRDAEWAKRGFIARVAIGEAEPLKIVGSDETTVWDMARYAYIDPGMDISATGQFPDTVNPSLWRQAILNSNYGLYEVCTNEAGHSIYQVRGYDLANISFVETLNGFIVVDVASYEESTAAAVKLFYDYLPEEKKGKKIHTIIYTHSHTDHFGGIQGVLKSGMTTGSVAIVAPDRFMEEAVSENITVGPAMQGRAIWMYGLALWRLPIPAKHGQVNNGLAIGSGVGTSSPSPVPPTMLITEDCAQTFDGTAVDFMLTPHTEAPAEMAFYFPGYKSICLAELCNQSQHNILTPRGAQVRDTIAWSNALAKMKEKWVDAGLAESAWGTHHWPRWGNEAIAEYIDKQGKLYRHLHDSTVSLMNQGYDMRECAERFECPPELAREWFNRGYYGATVFNVKAVYQKYLGWFDNNPASLWKLPGKTSAALYAKYLPQSGGNLVQAAKKAYDEGNYRWAAEALDHVCLAPDAWGKASHAEAMELQADAFEQLAYSAESGIWRNYFLTGAWRNRSEEVRKYLAR
jgi:alkyl sulfatase BDS1-like metallo-beta-lactamase superfamily hydrolase